jgi:hypothetical protein
LQNQNYRTKGNLLEMFHLIFADDSNFLFESLQDMESGSHHYARFGLVMHIGRGDKKSKTKAMHVPAKLNREHIREGKRIELRGGAYIEFTIKFKYVGSKLTSSLSGNLDVKTRIAITNSQMGHMKDLFRCKDISRRTKKFLYQAILISTVIWGCQTWELKEEEKRMLEVFHH